MGQRADSRGQNCPKPEFCTGIQPLILAHKRPYIGGPESSGACFQLTVRTWQTENKSIFKVDSHVPSGSVAVKEGEETKKTRFKARS